MKMTQTCAPMKPRSVKVLSHNFSPLYFKELAHLDKFSKNRFLGPHLCWRRSPLGPHLTKNSVPIGSPFWTKSGPHGTWEQCALQRKGGSFPTNSIRIYCVKTIQNFMADNNIELWGLNSHFSPFFMVSETVPVRSSLFMDEAKDQRWKNVGRWDSETFFGTKFFRDRFRYHPK